jgi:two-component system cell cycle sensor histidine kinase PleC
VVIDVPPPARGRGDYRALKQVLLNLLSNAVKFTPRGGRITLSAEGRRDAMGDRIRISVSDTGIGIAPDDLARLAGRSSRSRASTPRPSRARAWAWP